MSGRSKRLFITGRHDFWVLLINLRKNGVCSAQIVVGGLIFARIVSTEKQVQTNAHYYCSRRNNPGRCAAIGENARRFRVALTPAGMPRQRASSLPQAAGNNPHTATSRTCCLQYPSTVCTLSVLEPTSTVSPAALHTLHAIARLRCARRRLHRTRLNTQRKTDPRLAAFTHTLRRSI